MNDTEYILSLEGQREQLRQALEELTTAVEIDCKFDKVLCKTLSPYCEAARLVLQEAGND